MIKPLVFTFALSGALLLANQTFAHARLVTSSPASGAQIATSPSALTLSFDEEVKLAALTLTRSGSPVSVSVDKSAPSAKTVTVPVSPLAPGAYELHWTAISTDDGHVTKGSFTFTVLAATAAH